MTPEHKSTRVVVVGASSNPDRYSHKAVESLVRAGYDVIPVNPAGGLIQGLAVAKTLRDAAAPVDTVTMYVGAKISDGMTGDLIAVHPRRVVFNPGAENPPLAVKLNEAGIETVEGCTLVMLKAGAF